MAAIPRVEPVLALRQAWGEPAVSRIRHGDGSLFPFGFALFPACGPRITATP